MRHPLISGVLLTLLLAGTARAEVAEVMQWVQEWQQSVSQLQLQLETKKYRFADNLEPTDSRHWKPLQMKRGCRDLKGVLRLLAPDSYWCELQLACADDHARREIFGSHQDEIRVLSGLASGNVTGNICDQYTHGGLMLSEHVVTPLGYRMFEFNRTLLESLEDFDVRVVERNADSVRLKGFLTDRQAERELQVTIDARVRGLPTHMVLKTTLPGAEFTYAYHLLETVEVDDVVIPQHAIYYLHRPTRQQDYTLTDWRLVSAARDPSITATSIKIAFPSGVDVYDWVRDERWVAGVNGERVQAESFSTEPSEDLWSNMEGVRAAEELRASRRSIFPYIIGGAVLVTALAILLQWRRSTGP